MGQKGFLSCSYGWRDLGRNLGRALVLAGSCLSAGCLTPGRREEAKLRPCCVAPQEGLLIAPSPQNLLKRCHGSQASYLFQQDKFYDVALDTGDKVVQCGRRVDCLKLWLMWKAQGGQGLERRIDQAFTLTR